jgi:hypothetical protein
VTTRRAGGQQVTHCYRRNIRIHLAEHSPAKGKGTLAGAPFLPASSARFCTCLGVPASAVRVARIRQLHG